MELSGDDIGAGAGPSGGENAAETEHPAEKDTPSRQPFPWERLLYSIFFGFVAYVVFLVLIALSIIQFALALVQALSSNVKGHPSEELRRFNVRLLQYLVELLAYMTFVRDELPFPFGPFPTEPQGKDGQDA